jgi:hypothetical protein
MDSPTRPLIHNNTQQVAKHSKSELRVAPIIVPLVLNTVVSRVQALIASIPGTKLRDFDLYNKRALECINGQ